MQSGHFTTIASRFPRSLRRPVETYRLARLGGAGWACLVAARPRGYSQQGARAGAHCARGGDQPSVIFCYPSRHPRVARDVTLSLSTGVSASTPPTSAHRAQPRPQTRNLCPTGLGPAGPPRRARPCSARLGSALRPPHSQPGEQSACPAPPSRAACGWISRGGPRPTPGTLPPLRVTGLNYPRSNAPRGVEISARSASSASWRAAGVVATLAASSPSLRTSDKTTL